MEQEEVLDKAREEVLDKTREEVLGKAREEVLDTAREEVLGKAREEELYKAGEVVGELQDATVLAVPELLVATEVLDAPKELGAAEMLDNAEGMDATKVLVEKDENKNEEEDSRGVKLVVELLEEVVAAVVGDSWMDSVEEEAEELMALLNLPLAGEQESLKIKSANCDKVFRTKNLLYFHNRKQHVNPGNCNICAKYFSSKVKLDYHIQKAHMFGPEKQPRGYLCETCGRVFKERSNMNKHAKNHCVKDIKQKRPAQKQSPYPAISARNPTVGSGP